MLKTSFEDRTDNLLESQYANKCPYAMTPMGITIHETDNNASAENEIAYMQRNLNEVSFHFAVDELGAIQGLPLDRNGWHAGDKENGPGNRTTIAIEICKNYRNATTRDYYKARRNAEALVGYLLWKYNWGESDIYTHNHWSGKNCPRKILGEGYLPKFKKNAMIYKQGKIPNYTSVPVTTLDRPHKIAVIAANLVVRDYPDIENGLGRHTINNLPPAYYSLHVINGICTATGYKWGRMRNGGYWMPIAEDRPGGEVFAEGMHPDNWFLPRDPITPEGPGTGHSAPPTPIPPTNPTPPSGGAVVKGSKVTTNATHDGDGARLNKDSFTPGRVFTVVQISRDGKEALLDGVMTWIFINELNIVGGTGGAPTPPTSGTIKAGDRVRTNATHDGDGASLDSSVINSSITFTVHSVSRDGKEVLLKEVMTWVFISTLIGAGGTSPTPTPTKIKEGSKVTTNATHDGDGARLNKDSFTPGRVFTVVQISRDGKEALLDGVMTWIFINELKNA